MTTENMHQYLIAYDVASDTRQTRIAKTLESYGNRIQYSVFLIHAKPAKLLRLTTALTARLDLKLDSALICDLGAPRAKEPRRLESIGALRTLPDHNDPLVL